MSYKNFNWTVVAKDYNSALIRNYIFTESFSLYSDELGIPEVRMGVASENDDFEYITDLTTWEKCHEVVKGKVTDDYTWLEDLLDKIPEIGDEFISWAKENLKEANLEEKSNQELVDLLEEFMQKQETMYAYGTVLPILDFQDFSFIEDNLREILEEKAPDGKFDEYFEVFTEPSQLSFDREQEINLLKLMKEFYDNSEWKNVVQSKDLEEIEKEFPEFIEQLKKHREKHAGIYYVFTGPALPLEGYIDFVREHIKDDLSPEEKLEEIKNERQKISRKKEQYTKNMDLTEFEEAVLNLAGKLVWTKPRRKSYQSIGYYYFEFLMREIGNRLSLDLDQARNIPPKLLKGKLLSNEEVDPSLSEEIRDFHITLSNEDGSVSILYGDKALDFYEENIEKGEEEEEEGVSKVEGNTACKGSAKGTVKIVNKPEDMEKMEDGDILVSIATTPSIAPAMKKAAAIITDEGGLTCHAAIVSRELDTPCVIGTENSTSVLNDGDKVEVDAGEGKVKVLS